MVMQAGNLHPSTERRVHVRVNLSGTKFVAGLVLIIAAVAMAVALGTGTAAAGKTCATIQGGSIVDAAGNPVTVGFDKFGYNYQAHSYNGTYDGLDRVLDGKYYGQSGSWVNDSVQMKWSDDWLSNTDCNGDGKLDRGSAGISQGWLTNHIDGSYVDGAGATQHYTDFIKIGWVGPGGSLWGQYTVLQEVYNDSGGGSFRTNVGAPGLGLNDHWTS